MKRRFSDQQSKHGQMIQLTARDGQVQDTTALVAFCDASRSRARRSKGNLCVVLQPTPDCDPSDQLMIRLQEVIEDAFYETPGSATRGLRSALFAANTALYEHNTKADEGQALLLGINLALIRDQDIYFSSIGPAFALVAGGGQVQRFPERSIWLDRPTPSPFEISQDPPAGLRADVEPSLASATFGPDDTLLLCSPWAATQAVEQLASGRLDIATLGTKGDPRARTVLFAWGALAQSGGHSATVPAAAPSAPVTRKPLVSSKPAPVHKPQASAAQEPPAPEAPLRGPVEAPLPVEEPAAAKPTLPSADDLATPPWEDSPSESLPSAEEPYASYYKEDELNYAEQPASRPKLDLEGLRTDVQDTAKRLRREAGDVLDRMLPTNLPQRPAVSGAKPTGLALSGKALVLIAMVIPLIMVFIVVMMRVQYTRIRREQFESVQSLALSQYDAALQTDSTVYLRQGLYDALATSEEGLAIAPDDESLAELQRRILHELDSVDGIERLYHFWRLTPLDELATSPTDGSRIVIHDIDVYLLNRGSDRIYRFLLNAAGDALQDADTATPLLAKGDKLGGIEIGDLVDIAWMEETGSRKEAGFVALERNGSLISYDPQQGLGLLPVANSDTWLKPQAIGGYMGNLYVLDPLLGRIFKYEPVNDAYTNPPGDYVNPGTYVDLTGAVDMAIDGHVYVLFADGQISKLYEGDTVPLSVQGLPTPMKSPSALCASGDPENDVEGYLYIADSGNERIVQLSKEGRYIRQFRENAEEGYLSNLQGLYVDEGSQRMFLVSNGALWLARIPDLNE